MEDLKSRVQSILNRNRCKDYMTGITVERIVFLMKDVESSMIGNILRDETLFGRFPNEDKGFTYWLK